MQVTISVDENSLGSVVHDISSARGGQIISLDSEDEESSTNNSSNNDTTPIDPRKIYTPPDPFADTSSSSPGTTGMSSDDGGAGSVNPTRQIVARVPLKEMVGYLKHLRSLTAGRGTFVMSVDRFERMSGQRMKVALQEMAGEVV